MATIRQIRRRIRTVSNTAKITNALQLVAASKMRRAQERATASRPYAEKLREVLGDVAATIPEDQRTHPLLEQREGNTTLVVHVTPDRGLCGGLNANLNRAVAAFVLDQRSAGATVRSVATGRKGRDFLRRNMVPLDAEFTDLGDFPSLLDITPIIRLATDGFLSGEYDRVYLLYPMFVNTVTQRPTVIQVLPITSEEATGVSRGERAVEYIFEPSPEEVLDQMLPRYIELLLYQAMLESRASEQSARMVAMKNATDSAKDVVRSLTLAYNKARQEQITKELLDIVGGVEGLSA
jgi:F-type H+-transporting ATPase subunit gamma